MRQGNVRLIAGATVAAMTLGGLAVAGVAISQREPGGSRTARQRLTISRMLPDGPPAADSDRWESEDRGRALPPDAE